MDSIKLKAMAKINLGLDVVGRRPNGYHDVRMIMQSIYLYDNLTLTKVNNNRITIKTNLPYLPTNENNLVYKAAKLLFDEFHIEGGLAINLDKHIPVAAGLAGGSSDAAATLIGVNKLFRLGLTKNELMERGVTLGADIPFCIMRGTALSEGIGEVLTPIPPLPNCHIIIAKPDLSVSTKFVYEHLKLDHTTYHPDIDGIVDSLKDRNLSDVASKIGNTLEEVTVPSYPVIDKIKQFLINEGALNSLMSGSGPTVYGIFNNKETARRAEQKLKHAGLAKDIVLTTCFKLRKYK
ncbi:MAG: 4-(cytidine 5'-diphospho)-2-C-methyl-D-erythritol kinase [bacterium]|nr:4-(cytidine 5'-diphospho)-2-C-methyl-D-erythritol kinase [bacterium]